MWKTVIYLACVLGTINATPIGLKNMPIMEDRPSNEKTEIAMSTLNLPSNATKIRADITDGFTCMNKTYGYYADVDNDCQIFHVCLPVVYPDGKENTFRWSFICPEETLFSQESFTCVRHVDMNFDCHESERFYELNRNFGINPEASIEMTSMEADANLRDITRDPAGVSSVDTKNQTPLTRRVDQKKDTQTEQPEKQEKPIVPIYRRKNPVQRIPIENRPKVQPPVRKYGSSNVYQKPNFDDQKRVVKTPVNREQNANSNTKTTESKMTPVQKIPTTNLNKEPEVASVVPVVKSDVSVVVQPELKESKDSNVIREITEEMTTKTLETATLGTISAMELTTSMRVEIELTTMSSEPMMTSEAETPKKEPIPEMQAPTETPIESEMANQEVQTKTEVAPETVKKDVMEESQGEDQEVSGAVLTSSAVDPLQEDKDAVAFSIMESEEVKPEQVSVDSVKASSESTEEKVQENENLEPEIEEEFVKLGEDEQKSEETIKENSNTITEDSSIPAIEDRSSEEIPKVDEEKEGEKPEEPEIPSLIEKSENSEQDKEENPVKQEPMTNEQKKEEPAMEQMIPVQIIMDEPQFFGKPIENTEMNPERKSPEGIPTINVEKPIKAQEDIIADVKNILMSTIPSVVFTAGEMLNAEPLPVKEAIGASGEALMPATDNSKIATQITLETDPLVMMDEEKSGEAILVEHSKEMANSNSENLEMPVQPVIVDNSADNLADITTELKPEAEPVSNLIKSEMLSVTEAEIPIAVNLETLPKTETLVMENSEKETEVEASGDSLPKEEMEVEKSEMKNENLQNENRDTNASSNQESIQGTAIEQSQKMPEAEPTETEMKLKEEEEATQNEESKPETDETTPTREEMGRSLYRRMDPRKRKFLFRSDSHGR